MRLSLAAWSLFIVGLALPAAAQTFSGKVVGVADGDTISVMRDGREVRIRLYGVDCPEKRQAFGQAAKKETSRLTFGEVVSVRVVATDRYGRTVGEVSLPDGSKLGERLLGAGLAWWYRKYAKSARLEKLETEARAARRGLWSDPDPTPPWDFRHGKKAASVREPASTAPEVPAPLRPGCCRMCGKSKACGNGCIPWSRPCRKPPGCACQR